MGYTFPLKIVLPGYDCQTFPLPKCPQNLIRSGNGWLENRGKSVFNIVTGDTQGAQNFREILMPRHVAIISILRPVGHAFGVTRFLKMSG